VLSLFTRPDHRPILALLEEIENAEWSSLIVKARRIVNAPTEISPQSFVQDRVARGQPLLEVAISTRSDERRTLLGWLVGMDGKLPPEVCREVLNFLMPWWDPLRRAAGAGGQQPLQQEEEVEEEEEEEEEEG